MFLPTIKPRFGLILLFLLLPTYVGAGQLEPLRLWLAPAPARGGSAGETVTDQRLQSGASERGPAPEEACDDSHAAHGGGSGGSRSNLRSGDGRGGPRLESEHRPIPRRSYHFNDYRRQAQVRAYVRRPDGAVLEPELMELILGANPRVSFATPPEDGPAHGAHNVYVVEEGVEDGVLVVRTAKWITMHHSCRWGHAGKFDPKLINPQPLATIPFEIVVADLWSPNFHAAVTSGQELEITVLSYGKPVAGAEVTLTTAKGWSKTVTSDEQGRALIQLIRDYYPPAWRDFRRTERAPFEVSASWQGDSAGEFRGQAYGRVSYQTTHPWIYSPSQQDYASYAYGLLLATSIMVVGGGGVYLHRERRQRPHRGIVFDE